MLIKKVFDFEDIASSKKFKEFKYDYSTKMSKAMEFNSLECTLEGIKSGLYSSYEYVAEGKIWLEPEGLSKDIESFTITILPSNKVDNTKGYFLPSELVVVIEYEEE